MSDHAIDRISHSVLVVDDEEDIRKSLRDLIETCIDGTRVLTAASAEDGLEQLDANPVDLIITDYRMGGMDGLEFLMEAQRRAPQVPRMMITAYPDLDLVIKAINQARVVHFLPKPFRGANVLQAVGEALAERERDSERRERLLSALQARRAGSD